MDETNLEFIERRKQPFLNESIIEMIAEKAADKAIEKMEAKMYSKVGRTFVNKFFHFIGVVVIGLALFLESKGWIKI